MTGHDTANMHVTFALLSYGILITASMSHDWTYNLAKYPDHVQHACHMTGHYTAKPS